MSAPDGKHGQTSTVEIDFSGDYSLLFSRSRNGLKREIVTQSYLYWELNDMVRIISVCGERGHMGGMGSSGKSVKKK